MCQDNHCSFDSLSFLTWNIPSARIHITNMKREHKGLLFYYETSQFNPSLSIAYWEGTHTHTLLLLSITTKKNQMKTDQCHTITYFMVQTKLKETKENWIQTNKKNSTRWKIVFFGNNPRNLHNRQREMSYLPLLIKSPAMCYVQTQKRIKFRQKNLNKMKDFCFWQI